MTHDERKQNPFFFVSNADNLKTRGLNVSCLFFLVSFFFFYWFSAFHNIFSLAVSPARTGGQCLVWSAASGPASDSSFTLQLSLPHFENFCISARSEDKAEVKESESQEARAR